jgi:class 3 adenylate cyclase
MGGPDPEARRGVGPGEDQERISEPLPGIRTFLIADIRGYTIYTQEQGDEGAAALAARFAADLEPVVTEHGGQLLELRGDEALVVFSSARQAIRAAVALQQRFAGPDDQAIPVGIGLDAGEAVPVRGGFRGAALNTAARLCSLAAAGEVLATPEVVHLATRIPGVRFLEHGQFRLKGNTEPVHVVRLERDPPGPMQAPPAPPSAWPESRTSSVRVGRTVVLAGSVVVAVLLLALGSLALWHGADAGSSTADQGPSTAPKELAALQVALIFPPVFQPVLVPEAYMIPEGGVSPPSLGAGLRRQPAITVPGNPSYVRWNLSHGGVPWLHQTVRLVLTGRDDAPVVITRIRPYIIKRNAPLSGWHFEFECCGGVLVRYLEASLDCPGHPALLFVPNPRTGVVRGRTSNIDLEVSRSEAEELELTVNAIQSFDRWGVEVTYTHEGKTESTRATDPRMQVTGEKPGSIATYRYVNAAEAEAQHLRSGLHRAPDADTTTDTLRFFERFQRRRLC